MVLCGLSATAHPAESDLSQVRVQEALEATVAGFRTPGGVLLVAGPDQREFAAAAGFANLERRIAMTVEHRLHIASVGKMITAAAVLSLVQEGRLALWSPVLPLLATANAERLSHIERATISDLLSHHSGIADCFRNSGPVTAAHPDLHWSAEEVIRLAPCRSPGTRGVFDYSNTNFILLGRVLEVACGCSFAEALGARVLRPAGMSATSVGADPADATLAHGYRRPDGRGLRRNASLYAWSSPLGDAPITTTASDLHRFLSALLIQRNGLLEPAMVRAMITNRVNPDPADPDPDTSEGYGLGIEVEGTAWGPKLGHSGRLAGFSAEAWLFPVQEAIIILLLNGDTPPDTDLLEPTLIRLFGPRP
jgi:D-alanyl-D-alanine carboxypeptidase